MQVGMCEVIELAHRFMVAGESYDRVGCTIPVANECNCRALCPAFFSSETRDIMEEHGFKLMSSAVMIVDPEATRALKRDGMYIVAASNPF